MVNTSNNYDKSPQKPGDGGLSTTPPLLPFEIPSRFIDIPDTVINIISRYMNVVIESGTPGREVNIKKILNNAKMMFRDGIKYNDELWLQHCASSIRELIDFLQPENYRDAFSSIPKVDTDPKVESIFNFLNKAKTYLSDIVHFREAVKLGNFEKLYPGQGYGQIKKDAFLKQEDKYFEKVCIDIVCTINQLFCEYCAGS